MKTSTKWIIGIVLGLIVLAIIVTIGYVAFNRWGGPVWVMRSPGIHPWEGGRGMPMQPFRGIPNQRFIGFFPLRLIGGGLIFTGVLALIVLGIIALARSLGKPQSGGLTAAPTTVTATTQDSEHECPNCKRMVQDDWLHCPYCGTNLPQT
ncbi:MAG TPA: zinc ribbon domain-containing protein [Anaerolineales bacterium]|nr:zinc ribbon domain-containing protein [Anaerolineales bacterium]